MKFLSLIFLFLSHGAQAEIGGITGGGGGTTNPSPVGQPLVRRAVADSRMLLQAHLQARAWHWETVIKPNGHVDEDLKFLFDRPDDAFYYLERIKIEVRSNDNCYDAKKNPVDGSIYADQPGAICISSKSLGAKLSELNFEFETAALVMHEIVHQMGGDEDLAKRIQMRTIYGLKSKVASRLYADYSLFAKYLRENAEAVKDLEWDAMQPDPRALQYERVVNRLQGFRDKYAVDLDSHPLAVEAAKVFDGQVLKLHIDAYFAKSVDPRSDAQERAFYQENYLKGFREKDEISLTEYMLNYDGFLRSEYNTTFLTRITSREVLREELAEIRQALLATAQAVEEFLKVQPTVFDKE